MTPVKVDPTIIRTRPAPARAESDAPAAPTDAVDVPVPAAPRPLTGADVRYIKIVDFDKQSSEDKATKKGMKIRFY